ncbi:Hint domain-containing protein [Albidovulum sp.]|jgi:Ca2+-binding RTX toxin-like protein|uniref:Hint domain-containing protein n=2 Tax=Albidovulum sp. TaxID=1872424 RepID=UPI0030364226
MQAGYLLFLGQDQALNAGDAIGGGAVGFTVQTVLGAGQWTWSGTRNGATHANLTEAGHYYLATDGGVYFVPDAGTVTTLSSASATSAPAFSPITATAAADTIAGTTGAEVIYGGPATGTTDNTAAAAGSGNDSISGGDGNDVIFAGDGNDTVAGGAGADTIYGGSGNDSISAGDGNDAVFAGTGTDTIIGGAGADLIDGGAGSDTASYADSTAAVNVSLASGAGSGGTAEGDVLSAVENLTGSDQADTLAGSVGANLIAGGDGDDTITGGAGNDTLKGGAGADFADGDAGNDSITGGTGNDTLVGGIGADTLSGGDGNDLILGGGGHVGVGGTSLPGGTFHAISLGTFADIDPDESNGTSENSAALFGTHGSATAPLHARIVTIGANDANADGMIADTDRSGTPETFTVDGARYAVDSNQTFHATITFTDGTSGSFTAIVVQTTTGQTFLLPEKESNADQVLMASQPIESVTLVAIEIADTNMASVRVDSDFQVPATDTAADVIDAGAGNDTVDGGAGNDTIDGGSGDDSLLGGDGSDSFRLAGTFGNDTIIGGETGDAVPGTFATGDLLDASALTRNTTLTYSGAEAGTLSDGTSSATFSQVETVTLGSGDDTVDAGAAGAGVAVDAGAGADRITGSAGADTLSGGRGADTITGGGGSDEIHLGAGDGAADTVGLGPGDGADRIHDFLAPTANSDGSLTGHDRLDVSHLTDAAGNPVNAWDVRVTDTIGDGTGDAILTFPGGESVTLVGVGASQVDGARELHALGIPCFVRGTRIATTRGELPIEDLRAGDRVITLDHGARTLLWVGSRRVVAAGPAAPVEIATGRFGNHRPLRVSPRHRMLLSGWQAELHFGALEVLAAAGHLVDGVTVLRRPGGEVDYFHLLFDAHEIVFADGAATESLYPGPEALDALAPTQREEIHALMPLLGASYGPTARRCLKAHEALLLGGFGLKTPRTIPRAAAPAAPLLRAGT